MMAEPVGDIHEGDFEARRLVLGDQPLLRRIFSLLARDGYYRREVSAVNRLWHKLSSEIPWNLEIRTLLNSWTGFGDKFDQDILKTLTRLHQSTSVDVK